MTFLQNEVKTIAERLKDISLKEEQLADKKKILMVFQELRNRAEFGETEESAATQQEINSIDNTLKELRIKKAELQKNYDNIFEAKDEKIKNDIKDESNQEIDTSASGDKIFFVEPPPSFPREPPNHTNLYSPAVILDIGKLPTYPSRTQCPECMQFVTTETFTSVSSVTWLVCFMSALMGCVAGCCLLPFCMEKFKTTTHRCPKCRSKIITIKKL